MSDPLDHRAAIWGAIGINTYPADPYYCRFLLFSLKYITIIGNEVTLKHQDLYIGLKLIKYE